MVIICIFRVFLQQKDLCASRNKVSHRAELRKPAELSTTHTYLLKSESIAVVFPTNLLLGLRSKLSFRASHAFHVMQPNTHRLADLTQKFLLSQWANVYIWEGRIKVPTVYKDSDICKSQYSTEPMISL